MITRGSQDEAEARRYIALWQGMIGHWNILADQYRDAARGRAEVSETILGEAERTRRDIIRTLEQCDRLIDLLAPGNELRRELFQVNTALDALSESIAISAEDMLPRIEALQNIAGLKYLLGELKRNAGLGA